MAATKPLSVTLKQFYVTLRGEFVVKSISFPQRFHFPLAFPDTFVKADPVPCSALPTTQGNRHQLMALLGSRFPHFSYFLPFRAFFFGPGSAAFIVLVETTGMGSCCRGPEQLLW